MSTGKDVVVGRRGKKL